MGKSKNVQFVKYEKLVNEIERHSLFLEDIHQKHMKCRNGCDLCCTDFSIFPVEFHFILNELKKKNWNQGGKDNLETHVCAFLENHSCSIYHERPIMCRTHGLPLLYANDDGEFELSACELNFTEFDFEDFTVENTMPQDKYNSKLFLLNREFIAEFKEKKYGEMDLIPMKQLATEFTKNEK